MTDKAFEGLKNLNNNNNTLNTTETSNNESLSNLNWSYVNILDKKVKLFLCCTSS